MFEQMDSVLNQSGITGNAPSYPDSSLLLNRISSTVMLVAIGVSLASLAFAFFQYVISNGDPKAVKKAQDNLVWAVIAMVVAILAVSIRFIFTKMLGSNL